LSSFEISSFILPRKFYFCSPLISGGITTAAVVEEVVDVDDGFALEALKRFRRGELSEAALLEIMKLPQ
jgi:hypothetical protein